MSPAVGSSVSSVTCMAIGYPSSHANASSTLTLSVVCRNLCELLPLLMCGLFKSSCAMTKLAKSAVDGELAQRGNAGPSNSSTPMQFPFHPPSVVAPVRVPITPLAPFARAAPTAAPFLAPGHLTAESLSPRLFYLLATSRCGRHFRLRLPPVMSGSSTYSMACLSINSPLSRASSSPCQWGYCGELPARAFICFWRHCLRAHSVARIPPPRTIPSEQKWGPF